MNRTLLLVLLCLLTWSAALVPAALAQEGKAEGEAIAKAIGTTMHIEESKNFIWALEVSAVEAKKIIDTGERAIAIWYELTKDDNWRTLFGERKALVVVTKNRQNYMRFLAWYEKTHPVGWTGFQDVASAGEFFVMPHPRVAVMHHLRPRPIEESPGVIAHEIGRLVMMRYEFHRNFIPPWLEEGFGLWLEAKATGRNVCFTFGEAYGSKEASKDKLTGLAWTAWKALVREKVDRRQDVAMKAILPKRLSDLGADNAAKSWSVIDFLVAREPEAFPKFVKAMKRAWPKERKAEWDAPQGAAQEKALQEVYGMTLDQVDTEWRAFVKKEYKAGAAR